MPTADHKVECFRIAADRRRMGLPSWAETIDVRGVFHNDSMSFTEIRDSIVRSVKASRWHRSAIETPTESDDYYRAEEIVNLIDELGDVEAPDEFDAVWECIYNCADIDRIRIITS